MSKSLNPNIKKIKRAKRTFEEYVDGLTKSDRYVLSDVLTLIESTNADRRNLGKRILAKVSAKENPKSTLRLGITGSPGAGKSTFIEALGQLLIEKGQKVAVLAVDPSSTRSQGSILGDKTRMTNLSSHPNAFIRPTASANELGGVARATKESITICEAAGFDTILIESVGVGQSETELAQLVDMYLLLLLPGGGDDVQGIKRGVVELADMILINKSDGERQLIAKESMKDYRNAVRLFHHELEGWNVPVRLCSALQNEGIDHIYNFVLKYVAHSKSISFFSKKRNEQDVQWAKKQIQHKILEYAHCIFETDLIYQQLESKNSNIFEILAQVDQMIEEK